MKVSDVVQLLSGPNASRIKKKYDNGLLYTVADIELDLSQLGTKKRTKKRDMPDFFTKIGDVVISLMKQQAAIITPTNAGKMLTSNFVKCQFDGKLLDAWYFCYWINESGEVRRQNYRDVNLSVYTPRFIDELEMRLPPIETQQQIGELYKNLKHMQGLMDKQKDDWTRFTLQIIRNTTREVMEYGNNGKQ